MNKYQKIAFFFALAVIIQWISDKIQSDYLGGFLEGKIVELLITLLAINVATCGIIVTKLDELAKKYNKDFSPTINEIKLSLIYQIWLVAISIVTLILFSSKTICELLAGSHRNIFDTILITIFICAIDILRDTGLAIFVINGKK